jgi:hypothetical protein
MVAKGDSPADILDSLCRLVEERASGVLASVLLLDGDRLKTRRAQGRLTISLALGEPNPGMSSSNQRVVRINLCRMALSAFVELPYVLSMKSAATRAATEAPRRKGQDHVEAIGLPDSAMERVSR